MTNSHARCEAEQVLLQLDSLDTKMASIEDMLTFLKTTITTVSNAQNMMAASAESMARTFDKFERRIESQDERYSALVEKLSDREQIPVKSHYWAVGAALLPTVVIGLGALIGVLYVTKQELKASLSELSIQEKRNGNQINQQ